MRKTSLIPLIKSILNAETIALTDGKKLLKLTNIFDDETLRLFHQARYILEESQVLFGAYFFLHTEGTNNARTAENVLDVVSYLGGILSILLSLFMGLGTSIKNQTMVAKMLRQLYYTHKA